MTQPATPPTVTTSPRLGRGICWQDLVREIELDEADRQAQNKPARAIHRRFG